MIHITRRNLIEFVFRTILFLGFAAAVIFCPARVREFFDLEILGFPIWQIIWLIATLGLLGALFVTQKNNIAAAKWDSKYCDLDEKFETAKMQSELQKLVMRDRPKIFRAALFWLICVGGFLAVYFALDLDSLWIWVAVSFTYFLDKFAVVFWCPFRDRIIGNKCCNSCRIYYWGAWIIFLPLIAIPSFWTWSLLFLGLAICAKWEWVFHHHPERFYEITNKNLRCQNCRRPTGFCRVRNKK